MSSEETVDTLEIADLEYDVGGMGAVEPSEACLSGEGFVVVNFIPK